MEIDTAGCRAYDRYFIVGGAAMAKKMIKCIAVLLICTVLLSGCGVINGLLAGRLVPYDQMQYTRPNMIAFAAVLDKSCNYALEGEDIHFKR